MSRTVRASAAAALLAGAVLAAAGCGRAMATEGEAVLKGTAYYVSPAGSDANSGRTAEQAFRTIDKAAKAAAAGDVVNILPGVYEGRIRPANSGTADAPITYRRHGQGEAVITTSPDTDGGKWEERAAFKLGAGNHYTVLEGLTFRDAESWLYIGDGARHNTVRNCVFDGCRMYHGIYVNSGSYNRFVGCVFKRAMPLPDDWAETHRNANLADYISIWRDSHYNLVEGCQFNEITHVCVCIMGHDPAYIATHNIVRNCVFNNPSWKCVSTHASERTLVENCTMSGLAASFYQLQGAKVIVRRNVMHDYRAVRTEGAPTDYVGALWLRSNVNEYGSLDIAQHGRYYNNVFYGGDKAITYRPVGGVRIPVCENVFKNNVFYRNKATIRLPLPFYARYTTQQANFFFNNLICGAAPGEKVIELVDEAKAERYTVAEAEARLPEACKAVVYKGNLDADPGFADEAGRDFRLKKGSPCIDAGAALTRTAEAGQGTDVPVEDPLYFCDGFGIIDADEIVVGANRPARIVRVDYINRVLKVDRELSWKKGDAVNLPYEGAGPDIGRYEFGAK